MKCARPLFFLLALLTFATAALAGDAGKSQTPATPKEGQVPGDLFGPPASIASLLMGPSRSSAQADNGFRLLTAHPAGPNQQPFRDSLATLDHGLCYTLRMYKVKPTEHLPDRNSGRRGYTTCELAKNYQVRSAIAHARSSKDLQSESSK